MWQTVTPRLDMTRQDLNPLTLAKQLPSQTPLITPNVGADMYALPGSLARPFLPF